MTSGRKSRKLTWFPAIAHECLGARRGWGSVRFRHDVGPLPTLSLLSAAGVYYWVFLEFQEGWVARRYQVLPQPPREVPQLGSPSLTPTEQDDGCTLQRRLPLFLFSYSLFGLASLSSQNSSWFTWAVSILLLNIHLIWK